MPAVAAFRQHLAFIAAPHTEAEVAATYADGATLTLMYSPEGHTHVLEGGAAIARFQTRIGEFFDVVTRAEPVIRETADGLVAEYEGHMISKESGKPYDQEYIAVVIAEGEKIKTIREYYDPIRVLRATGEME